MHGFCAFAVPPGRPWQAEADPVAVDQEFRKDYGTTPNALLAARYGVATGTIPLRPKSARMVTRSAVAAQVTARSKGT